MRCIHHTWLSTVYSQSIMFLILARSQLGRWASLFIALAFSLCIALAPTGFLCIGCFSALRLLNLCVPSANQSCNPLSDTQCSFAYTISLYSTCTLTRLFLHGLTLDVCFNRGCCFLLLRLYFPVVCAVLFRHVPYLLMPLTNIILIIRIH